MEVSRHEISTAERYADLVRVYLQPTFGSMPAGKLDAELLAADPARGCCGVGAAQQRLGVAHGVYIDGGRVVTSRPLDGFTAEPETPDPPGGLLAGGAASSPDMRDEGSGMLLSGAWDEPPLPEMLAAERARPAWLDELVSLHVLAEHGDQEAAATARAWIATDTDARRVWDGVENLREQLVEPPGISA